MKVKKSQNRQHSLLYGGDDAEKAGSTTDFFFQAIENADGVPFQLVFGQRIGEGYYLSIGSGLTRLLNTSPENFTEKIFQEMIEECIPLSDAIPSDPMEARKKFVSGELKSYRAELLLRLPGGKKKWIRDASLPLVDDETGNVIGAFGILFDISDQKDSTINARLVQERAHEYDRLKSAFLRNISHEIRTPLNAIVGFSTLLGEPGQNPEQQKEYRKIITQSTDHLLSIISDIIELSKIDAGNVVVNYTEVNINNIVQDIYREYIDSASAKGILFRLPMDMIYKEDVIITDSFKLKTILHNLVGNALKFTDSGIIEMGYEVRDAGAEFFVSDTGIGISSEHKEDIFSRFFQEESNSARSFEGTGLGLTISRAYVQLLGGTIWFTSNKGQGSEFRFTVPPGKTGPGK